MSHEVCVHSRPNLLKDGALLGEVVYRTRRGTSLITLETDEFPVG
jgi:hypothetical protein